MMKLPTFSQRIVVVEKQKINRDTEMETKYEEARTWMQSDDVRCMQMRGNFEIIDCWHQNDEKTRELQAKAKRVRLQNIKIYDELKCEHH